MLTSQPTTCSAVAGTPRFGPAGCFFAGCATAPAAHPHSKTATARDCASAANAGRHLRPTARDGASTANTERDLRSALRIDVAHVARGRDAPALDRVVVIAELRPARAE